MDKRVLVVDDERATREGVMLLLECEELASAGAADRATAEELLDHAHFPVILADLCLETEEEGQAFINHALRSCPHSRVVVLSGHVTDQTERALLDRGVALVLRKPASGDVILAAIQAVFAELEAAGPADAETDLETLYVSARRKLIAIARGRFRLSQEQAEDVLQEAWILYLEKRRFVRSVSAWLAAVVANLSRQHLERTRRRRETSADDAALDLVPASPDADASLRLSVQQALAHVDERARDLCQLIAIEGLSYAEVSEATGLPLGSIGPTYLRAKRKLREVLRAA